MKKASRCLRAIREESQEEDDGVLCRKLATPNKTMEKERRSVQTEEKQAKKEERQVGGRSLTRC